MDAIDHLLAQFLLAPWAVPALVAGLALGCVVILVVNDRRHHRGLTRALRRRLDAIEAVRDAPDAAAARAAFADDFAAIDAVFRDPDDSPAIARAWEEHAETIVDPDARPIAVTGRFADRIAALGDETRVLAWWANLYVAFGLTFTFLGIVAALTATTDGIREAGGDAGRMGLALTTLLTLTAAKFWTSIAGVGGSIVLRLVDRRWHAVTRRRLDRVAAAVDRGTVHLTAERIAIDQLRTVERLSGTGQIAAPPSESGQSEAAGSERPDTAAFAAELDEARAAMRTMHAGFAETVDGVQAALDRLAAGIDALGGALAERAAAAAQTGGDAIEAAFAASGERFGAANAEFSTALGEAARQVAGLADAIGRTAGAATRHSGEIDAAAVTLADAAAPMRGASDTIAGAVDRCEALLRASDANAARAAEAAEAAAHALAQTASTAERAWAAYAGRFADVDAALAAALDRIGGAARQHAEALNMQTGRIDSALAQSVDRLHGVVDGIAAALDGTGPRRR